MEFLTDSEEKIRNAAMQPHMDKIKQFLDLSGKAISAMADTRNVIHQICCISDFREKLDLPTPEHLDAAGALSEEAASSMIEVLERHIKDLEAVRGHYAVWFKLAK